MLPHADDGRRPDVPREGAAAVTLTSCNAETPTESYSFRTVLVWIKAYGRKVKINAILDDASNETLLNEAVAGILGLQEPFEKVQVYVLNETVEKFQSMPIKTEIESVDDRFSKEISAKTCLQKVIIVARVEIRKWDHKCNECKRRRSKPACQIMVPLPKTRLRFSFRPFTQTAVDFAGPLYTVQGRGKPRQKRWLCRFTCLETRAVHLEMAWGLDTDTFLNVFARLTSRRGVP